jgi:hypothetical protein
MYVSYRLDYENDWHQKTTKRVVLQGILGWVIPFIAILLFVGMRYGYDLFDQEHMQFVIAVYLFFLFMLNRQGYIVYLSQRIKSLKAELAALGQHYDHALAEAEAHKTEVGTVKHANEEKQSVLIAQIDFMKNENAVQWQKMEGLEQENRQLLDSCSKQEVLLASYRSRLPKKTYEIKYSASNILAFKEDEIAGFIITDRRNEKPLIDLFSKDGRKVLTNEASLRNVEREFVEMIRLNRWCLVAQDQILDFVESKETGAYVILAFTNEKIEVKKDRWKTIGAQIRTLVHEQSNRHRSPSPDALT